MKIIILFHLWFFVIISRIKCQQVLNEELVISTQPGEEINIKKTKIERRFLEDLQDSEWHVAHIKGAMLDGRRDCKSDTFADKARRYRKMLKDDGARVEYVSADPLPVNKDDIVEDSCKVNNDLDYFTNNGTVNVTSASFMNVTNININIEPTAAAQNVTSAVNTTVSMKATDTTPKLDIQATTVKSKEKPKKKKLDDKLKNDTVARRASEYMFSSVEYYDESIEFDADICPDAVEVIGLQIDQLRSYDLECEKTVEWRSLE